MKIDKTFKLLAAIAAMIMMPLAASVAQTTPADITGVNNAVPVAIPQSVPSPATPGTVAALPADNVMQNAPTGTPSIVGEVMNNLQQSQNNMSVNDLAKAQDALVRLDMMLKLEQKLGELKKAQDERNGSTAMAVTPFGMPNVSGAQPMVGQVPASALAIPVSTQMAEATPAPLKHKKHDVTAAIDDYSVEQVMGLNGNMTAVLTTPDGTRKNVRVGDSVGDHMKVAAITTSGVELRGPKGKSKTLDVENDGVVLAPMMR